MDSPHLFPLPSFIVFDHVADLEPKLMGITGRKGPSRFHCLGSSYRSRIGEDYWSVRRFGFAYWVKY